MTKQNRYPIRIIPCLDVQNGRVVKGVNFVNIKDAGDPVEIAQIYDEQGADELVFLDITASVENRSTMYEVVRQVASCVFIPLTVGGGVRRVDDVGLLLQAGADKVAINSAAIQNPQLVEQAAYKYGSQCIVGAIDAKKVGKSWHVFSHGGRFDCNLDAIQWAKKLTSLGAGEILLTSMDTDGTKKGFDLELTRVISENTAVPIIASGGVGKIEHFVEGVFDGKADGLLAASVFHFKEMTIEEVKMYCQKQGIAVRT